MPDLIVHIASNGITNKTAVRKFFDEVKAKNGKYLLTAKSIKRRSIPQNKYYWGVVVAMIKERMIELGNDVDEQTVHDYLKDRFNRKELYKDGINIGSVGDTTTKLTTIEFEEYQEKCKRFAADVLNIYIPDPNKQSVMFAHFDNDLETTIIER